MFVSLAIAAGVHAAGVGVWAASRHRATPPLGADEPASRATAVAPMPSPAELEAERARLLAQSAEGRLGETIIRLEWIDSALERGDVTVDDREHALATYRALLADVRARTAGGEELGAAISAAAKKDGKYKRMYPRLSDALVRGGGSCVALSTLATSLAYDAGRADAGVVVFANHMAPDVGGFHFGMTAHCKGAGVRVAARDLLAAYAKARATNDKEPFAVPRASVKCDDPGDVYGGQQLEASDDEGAPARSDAECRRRTVMDEYEEDVEVLGANGASLGAVTMPRASTLDLAGHAASAACFERVLAAVDDRDDVALVLALGDAAIAAEEAARVFADAGELDVAHEFEHRLAAFRERAAAPLERVIAILADDKADADAAINGAGRLVALGEGGRTAMLLAAERHRGYWELANLVTRPSSAVGAAARWNKKPLDVRLDVIDALPCASQTLLRQLDDAATPDARLLRDACEARVRGERASCDLDAALAETTADATARAALVRRLAVRCRDPEFVAAARAWASGQPEDVSAAVLRRLR